MEIKDMTREQLVEELTTLRESEKRFHLLAENSLDYIFHESMEGTALYCSPAIERILGYTSEERRGKHFSDVIAPYCLAEARALFEKVVRGEAVDKFEIDLIRKDGRTITAEITLSPVMEKGEVTSIFGVIRDITERRKAEEALRETKERMDVFMNSAPEVFGLLDSNMNLVEINEAGLRLYGEEIKREDVLGRHVSELYPAAFQEGRFDKYAKILQTGKPVIIDDVLPPPPYENTRWAIRAFKAGKGIGVILSNITELKRAEEELRKSEQQYRLLAENVNDVIWAMDMNLNYTYISPSITSQRGYTVEEYVNTNLKEVATQESYEMSMRVFKEELELEKLGQAPKTRFRLLATQEKCKDGSTIWLEGKMSFLRDDKGKAVGILGVSRDITARKRIEEALRESEERYHSLVDNASVIIARIDLEGKFVLTNKRFSELTGLKDDEIIGKGPEILLPYYKEEEFARMAETVQKTVSEQVKAEVELKYTDINGNEGWILQTSYPWYKSGGDFGGAEIVSIVISERKLAEQALRASEEKYRALVENTNDIAYSLDSQGQVTYIGPQVERYGIEQKKALGESFWEFVFPEDREKLTSDLEKTMTTGEEFTSEFRLLDKDGQIHWLEEEGKVQRDESGNIAGLSGMLRDITQRKEAEEALRESEERWRSLVENAPNIILICDKEGTIQFVNHTVEGLATEEVTGTSQYDYIEPEYHDLVRNGIEQVFETGQPGKYQVRGAGPKGTMSWYETNVSPIKNADEVTAVTLMVTDITERKEAEKALRESESKYRILIENLPLKVFTKDREAVYVSCNDNFSLDLGITQNEFRGKTDYDFFPSELAEKYRADDKRVMSTGLTEDIEEKYVKDGKMTWVHTVKTPVRDDKGEVVGMLGIFWDITERKNFARRLAAAQEEERRRLSIQLHDDLGQLLTVARIRIDRLRDARFSDIVTITRELSDVSSLLEDVLEKTRDLSRRLRPPLLDQLGLGAALRNLAAQFGSDTGMKVVLNAEENSPQLPEEVQMLIYRVARECLTNVARHAGAKKVVIRLDIDEEYVELSVADDGKGFNVGEVEKRSDCLGIRSMRSRVTNAGGIFQLVSEISRGAKLQVKVPVKFQED